MFRLSWSKLGMFRLCARPNIASRPGNFSRKIAHARLKIRVLRTCSFIFRLCSTYASTVLDLRFDCASPSYRLCSMYVLNFSTKIGHVLSVLDTRFDQLDQFFEFLDLNLVYLDWTCPIFRLSRPKAGMFRFCASLKIASRPRILVTKLHLSDFQCRNKSRAPQLCRTNRI